MVYSRWAKVSALKSMASDNVRGAEPEVGKLATGWHWRLASCAGWLLEEEALMPYRQFIFYRHEVTNVILFLPLPENPA